MLKKLESLDSDLKTHHSAIVDLVEKEDDLEREQDVLDQHDDEVLDLSTRLERLIDISPRSNTHSVTKTAGRRLDHLHKSFEIVTEAVI